MLTMIMVVASHGLRNKFSDAREKMKWPQKGKN